MTRLTRLPSLCWITSALLAFIAGCTVGPDYVKPVPHPPQTWADPGKASYPTSRPVAYSTEPADLAAWWKSLNDAQLTSLIERSIAANLDIRRASSSVRQARATRAIATADFFPTVDASGSFARSGGGGGRSSASLFRAGLDASWEIDVFGGIRRNVEAADADLQAAVESRRDVLVSVVAEVALNYVDLRGTQRQIEIAQGNLLLQRKNAELVRTLFNNGNGFNSRLDVANADASVATTASQIPLLEIRQRQTSYALGVLLDRAPEDLLSELTTQSPLPVPPMDVPIGLPSELMQRRPDIRRAEAQLHAATARIGVATADLFPRFSLTGNFGYGGPKFASLFDWANHTYGFGPGFTLPLFDAGRIFNNIKIQDEAQEQAFLTYRGTVLTALQDVENALIAYVKEYEHRAALADAVTANRDAVKYATTLYRAGQTDFLNVLSAQQALFGSENALVQSDRSTVTNLIALYKALGGGWEPDTTPVLAE